MLALRMQRHGFDGLSLTDVPSPELRAGFARVEVRAAGLNPSDLGNVLGKFHQTTLPRTPGRDYAGVVVEGPDEWRGAEVWGSGGELGFAADGTHAQQLIVPVASLARKPANVTFAMAAAAGVPLATAWQVIVGALQVRAGQMLLVTGAAGSVGGFACQIGRMLGARVIGVVRREPTIAADERIDSSTQDVASTVHQLTRGEGADACLDTVGGELFDAALHAMASGGRLGVITAKGDGNVTFNLRDFYHRRLHLIGVDSLQLDSVATGAIYRELREPIEHGRLTLATPEARPLQQAVEAYRAMQASEKGKVVLTMA